MFEASRLCVAGGRGNKRCWWGGGWGCSPLCSGPHSTHSRMLLSPPTVSHWESIIPLSVQAKMDGGGSTFFPLPLWSSILLKYNTFALWSSDCRLWELRLKASTQGPALPPFSFFFFFFVSVAFPANLSRAGRGVVSHPAWRKAGSCEPALFKSAQWVWPNCLRVLSC